MNGDWSACSASCGGGSRTRSVFCTEENGNETTKLPDHKCSSTHKPHIQETCNTVSCPMWETDKWSEVRVHARFYARVKHAGIYTKTRRGRLARII
ncbi:ADAMTS-like protein 3 [Trachymyrmex cornetzi]|uniref:ADAMTS-like protein 3 n=1 Tax=Trachymyrmex cornetzi TaxID=471704 RepID=A0A151J460_9HYME|nr:ADAMTS-like protein 3 [Trachymyrmex cornetzi]